MHVSLSASDRINTLGGVQPLFQTWSFNRAKGFLFTYLNTFDSVFKGIWYHLYHSRWEGRYLLYSNNLILFSRPKNSFEMHIKQHSLSKTTDTAQATKPKLLHKQPPSGLWVTNVKHFPGEQVNLLLCPSVSPAARFLLVGYHNKFLSRSKHPGEAY